MGFVRLTEREIRSEEMLGDEPVEWVASRTLARTKSGDEMSHMLRPQQPFLGGRYMNGEGGELNRQVQQWLR